MKTKFILTAFLLLLPGFLLRAQKNTPEKKTMFLYIESGIDFISCEAPDKDYIRADVDPFYNGTVAESARSLLYNEYFGIKFEYRVLRNLLGVSGGIRYNRMVSSIGKTSYWEDTPEFFYVRYWSDGENTEYAKVTEINQKTDYLGIPLELRIYPYKDYPVNVYFKAGASLNMNIGSKTGIVFLDEAMYPYEASVASVVENPPSYFGSFHLGAGVKIGRLAKTGFILEASVPVAVLMPEKASLVTPLTGAGLQFMIRVPLTKKTEK